MSNYDPRPGDTFYPLSELRENEDGEVAYSIQEDTIKPLHRGFEGVAKKDE